MTRRLICAAAIAGLLATGPVPAMAQPLASAGYRVVPSTLPFVQLEESAKAAIAKNGMNLVNRASASDGAKGRGVTIRGDAVLGVFRNDFAVRMLAANVDAGIEAPIRLHLVEEPDGTSSIRYYLPSAVFAPYASAAVTAVGRDLDGVFEQIVTEAVQARK